METTHLETNGDRSSDVGSPAVPSKRIVGFDIARALAVFGMVLINFKVVMVTGSAGPPWLAQLAGLFEGRAAATFVVLAGIGIALLVGRLPSAAARLLAS